MSGESAHIEDPADPETIFSDLPERERAEFARQYHEAVDAAHDLAGCRRLQQFLRAWRRSSRSAGPDIYDGIDLTERNW